MISLPEQFIHNMKSRLDGDYPAYEKSFEQSSVKAFHCNSFYLSAKDCASLIKSDAELSSSVPIEGLDASFITDSDHIGHTLLHHAGAVYSQDPSAMLPAGAVILDGNEKVLDLCAAPGGKSSQLAMKLNGPLGLLIANEPVMSRNRILIQNMERMAYPNVLVSCMSPDELASHFPAYFDVVLCDAPCSGEGMFRKYPESIPEWSTDNVSLCASRQREILDNAVRLLKPGGLLIYSTCTYEKSENEDNVSYILSAHPMSLVTPPEVITDNAVCTSDGCYTFYPHKYMGEGQFVSYLRKDGVPTLSSLPAFNYKQSELKKLISELGDSIDLDPSLLFKDRKGAVHLLPARAPLLPPSGFTMPGIMAFEISDKSKRIIPHHQLFKAAAGSFRYRLDLSDHRDMALAYINGMELNLSSLDISGIPNRVFLPVMYKGYVLGGGRIDRDRLKNLYPKGLRDHL